MIESIYKANTISFNLVHIEDAEFILSLRENEKYNKYLSEVKGGVYEQKKWIEKYKAEEEQGAQFYFIVRDCSNNRVGTIRIYDISYERKSFCWGSWILTDDCSWSSALECVALIYYIGFVELGLLNCDFDVRKLNENVVKLHKKLGAEIFNENEIDYFFRMKKVTAQRLINKVLQLRGEKK